MRQYNYIPYLTCVNHIVLDNLFALDTVLNFDIDHKKKMYLSNHAGINDDVLYIASYIVSLDKTSSSITRRMLAISSKLVTVRSSLPDVAIYVCIQTFRSLYTVLL